MIFKYFDARFEKENTILVLWFHTKIRFIESDYTDNEWTSIQLIRLEIDRVCIVWCRGEKGQSVALWAVIGNRNWYSAHVLAFILSHSLRSTPREKEKEKEHSGLSFTVSPDPYHLVFHLRSANCFFAIATRAGPVFFIPDVFQYLISRRDIASEVISMYV